MLLKFTFSHFSLSELSFLLLDMSFSQNCLSRRTLFLAELPFSQNCIFRKLFLFFPCYCSQNCISFLDICCFFFRICWSFSKIHRSWKATQGIKTVHRAVGSLFIMKGYYYAKDDADFAWSLKISQGVIFLGDLVFSALTSKLCLPNDIFLPHRTCSVDGKRPIISSNRQMEGKTKNFSTETGCTAEGDS